MGCCGSRNEVTPLDTPIKKRPLKDLFKEKDITDSSKPNTGDNNNNNAVKRSYRPPPQKPRPPPPPQELEIHTLAVLEGHEAYVDVGGWSPVTDVLVTASSDRNSYLWTLQPHQAPERVELSGEDLDSPVSCLGWSDDGEGFVLGHDDGKVSLWRRDGDHEFTWWPHEAPVLCVSVRGLGRAPLILSGGDCSAVSQYMPGADRQELTQLYMTNDFSLTWVEWLDADLFLSADSGGNIQLHHFDLARLTKKITAGKYEDKEEARRSFTDHAPFGVYQVRVKPGSTETFASCSVDSTVRVWSANNKKNPLLQTLEGHVGYVTAIQWIPDSNKIISASFDYSLKIWDAGVGRCLYSLERHKDAVTRFSLSADKNYIVSSGQDGDLHFWDAKDGSHIETYEGAGRIMLSQWNPHSDKVLITTYKVATVLEVTIDSTVRSSRKQKALQAVTDLITKEEETNKDDEPSQVDQKQVESVRDDNGEKTKKKHHNTKHEKKHKKKKHRS